MITYSFRIIIKNTFDLKEHWQSRSLSQYNMQQGHKNSLKTRGTVQASSLFLQGPVSVGSSALPPSAGFAGSHRAAGPASCSVTGTQQATGISPLWAGSSQAAWPQHPGTSKRLYSKRRWHHLRRLTHLPRAVESELVLWGPLSHTPGSLLTPENNYTGLGRPVVGDWKQTSDFWSMEDLKVLIQF